MPTIPQYTITTSAGKFVFASTGGIYRNSALATALGIAPKAPTDVISGMAVRDTSGTCFRVVLSGTRAGGAAGTSNRWSETVWVADTVVSGLAKNVQGKTWNPEDVTTETPEAGITNTIEFVRPKRSRTYR